MEFEFNNQLSPQNTIEIENIGHFALEATNSSGLMYYYIVKTIMGQTLLAECGPVYSDLNIIPSGFDIRITKLPYNEHRIYKQVALFLNDKYKKIVDASEIDIYTAIDQFVDVREYLRNLDEDTF